MASLATAGCTVKRCSHGDGDFTVHQPCSPDPPSSDNVDHRMATQEALKFLREAEKNRRLVEKLEKERTLIIQCRKNGWTDVYGQLEEYEKVLDGERNADKMNFQKQLLKIHNGVRKFQRHLTDVKPTSELIEQLKEIMSEVEISINTLKEEQRSSFEELLKDERTCRQEITAYEKKIENWSQTVLPERPKQQSALTLKTKSLDTDLPVEVRAFEIFLQKTGGSNGGWDQFDHQVFLKVRMKHSGQPAYRKEAKLYLPGKTVEEIEQHEEWYQELISLQDRKREAIQTWKAIKQQERQTRIQSQEEAGEAERREKEAKSQAHLHKTEEERRETAQQLEEWREKRKRKQRQEEEQRLAEEIQKSRQAKEERRRQLEVKMAIEKQLLLRREEKKEEERRRKEEEQREMDERRKEAAKGIKYFNERDLHKVEAKLQEKKLREKEEEERQRRITAKLKDKVDGHISRDTSRLIRPTKGWEERMKHVGPSGGGPVLQMFHRAIPTWRQGL
ncbi:coiled-coil domain-containing protein 112 [Xyrichtys novacula]|uniref:Coiled-coil domain-containing protein 112 n=1 Tax=Xyrichtys novacula TaxID=13765 RepID=A0AAV1G9J9_XYRNO|nr:coiled-coil domain-containing protein 112 [Xyrichtys novacula]